MSTLSWLCIEGNMSYLFIYTVYCLMMSCTSRIISQMRENHLIAPLDLAKEKVIRIICPHHLSLCFNEHCHSEFWTHLCWRPQRDTIKLTSCDLMQSALTACVKLYCSVSKEMAYESVEMILQRYPRIILRGNDEEMSLSRQLCMKSFWALQGLRNVLIIV